MVSCGTNDIIKTLVYTDSFLARKPRIFRNSRNIKKITLLQNLDINSSFFFSSSAGFLFCCLNFSKYFALFFSSLSASNIPIIIHAWSRAYLIIAPQFRSDFRSNFRSNFRTLLIYPYNQYFFC